MNKLEKIAFILPRGALYRYKTGVFKVMIRYAPLTLPTLVALIPEDLNIKTEIYDEGAEIIDVTKIDADLICLTSITGAANRAYEYAAYFRAKGKTVIMGGVHATLLPQEALEHVDSVAVGMGIETFPQILRDYKNGCLKKIYAAREDMPLTNFPFPKRDCYQTTQKRFITTNSVQATYGCINKCAFCVTPYSCKGYKHRPVEEVVDEIRQIKSNTFIFVDPSPIEDNYAKELYRAMIPLKKRWASPMTIKIAEDKELLDVAVKSGMGGVLIGFESVSQRVLTDIKKGFNSVNRYYNAVRALHKNNVGIMGCFVFGLDSDDKNCFKRTIEFINQANIDVPRFTVNTAYPGTPFYEQMKAAGRIIEDDWSMYDCQHVVVKPLNMSAEELQAGHHWAWKEAYKTKSIIKRLAGSRSVLPYALGANIAYKFYAYNLPKYTRDVMCDYSDINPAARTKK
jgi:radical SAM superfamily enzyme YgiQ (UPF0313 family)